MSNEHEHKNNDSAIQTQAYIHAGTYYLRTCFNLYVDVLLLIPPIDSMTNSATTWPDH